MAYQNELVPLGMIWDEMLFRIMTFDFNTSVYLFAESIDVASLSFLVFVGLINTAGMFHHLETWPCE